MAGPGKPIFLWLFLLVAGPIGAVVVVMALLLFGVKAHTVFIPGFALKHGLESIGLHVPNGVGVAGTVLLWWAIIAVVGLAWERMRRR